LRAGSTCAVHFSVVLQALGRAFSRRRGKVRRFERGPDNPCILIGDRHRRAVEPAPLSKLIDPLVTRIGFVGSRPHHGARAVNE